ncbi:class E sortase [Streptomyces sp. NPDC002644]
MTGWRPEDDETVALRIPPGTPGIPTDPTGPLGPTRRTAGDPLRADGTLHTVTRPDAAAPPELDEPRHGARTTDLGITDPGTTAPGTTDPASTMRLAAVSPPGVASSTDTAVPPAAGGRAARRRAAAAAKGRRGRRAAPRAPEAASEAASSETASEAASGTAGDGAPLSRVERRRAERARRPGPAVVISRAVGELFITTGVLMILFVAYQLWWTNVLAAADVDRETVQLQDDWDKGARDPGTFEAGQGFALLHMPTLDVVVPVAESIDKERVLDRGMVGHYGEDSIPTAMPGEKGNFGIAGHRNTHGEPFRYINRLKPGDPIVVETRDTYYVYRMTSILPSTSPSNVSVLDPVPPGSGFTGPGRYITLTTCTPEFTSTYRMIVWGKMDEERPRGKGKPDALVNP